MMIEALAGTRLMRRDFCLMSLSLSLPLPLFLARARARIEQHAVRAESHGFRAVPLNDAAS